MTQELAEPATPISPTVLIYCDVIHIAELEPRLSQAVINCLSGKTRPVLLAAKALLLGRGYEHTIANQHR